MGKLRKLTIGVTLEETGESYHYVAHMEYSPGSKLFFIRVPEDQRGFQPEDKETKKLAGFGVLIRGSRGSSGLSGSIPVFSAELETDAIKKAATYFRAFLTAVRATHKVIIYKFEYKTEGLSIGHNLYGPYTGRKQALEFGFVVGEENTIGSKKTYLRRYSTKIINEEVEVVEKLDELIDQYHKWQVMDWTEEREQFFENLKKGMHGMIVAVDEFVSDNEVFAAQIDAGAKFLLTEG